MSQVNLENEQVKVRQPYATPKYTLGYLIIVIGVTLIASGVILLGGYSSWQADGQKIMDEGEWYRLFTFPFAIASFLDLSFLLISFLCLLFTLTEYENKYSTLYTLYHFWKVNISIGFWVSMIYYTLFFFIGMKNFIMNVSGIFPYTLHIYLKKNLANPSQSVSYWFLPCPVNRWVIGFLACFFSSLFTPESQGCSVVFLNYMLCSLLVLAKHLTGVKCFYFQGPLLFCLFSNLEKIVPKVIKEHYAYCKVKKWSMNANKNELVQESVV